MINTRLVGVLRRRPVYVDAEMTAEISVSSTTWFVIMLAPVAVTVDVSSGVVYLAVLCCLVTSHVSSLKGMMPFAVGFCLCKYLKS